MRLINNAYVCFLIFWWREKLMNSVARTIEICRLYKPSSDDLKQLSEFVLLDRKLFCPTQARAISTNDFEELYLNISNRWPKILSIGHGASYDNLSDGDLSTKCWPCLDYKLKGKKNIHRFSVHYYDILYTKVAGWNNAKACQVNFKDASQ